MRSRPPPRRGSTRQAGPVLGLGASLRSPRALRSALARIASSRRARPYDGEVAYADACFGRRARRRAAARRATSSLVAVLGRSRRGARRPRRATHGFFVYQPTLRIPLVIAGPGRSAGARLPGLARTADLLPTILARLLDARCPPASTARICSAGPRRARATRRRSIRETLGWAAAAFASAWARSSTSTRRGRSSTTSPPIPARRATSPPRGRTTSRGCAAASRAPAPRGARGPRARRDDPRGGGAAARARLRDRRRRAPATRRARSPIPRTASRSGGASRRRPGRRRGASTRAAVDALRATSSRASRRTPPSAERWPPRLRARRPGAARPRRRWATWRRSRPPIRWPGTRRAVALGAGGPAGGGDARRAPRDRPRPATARAAQPPRHPARARGSAGGGARRVRRARVASTPTTRAPGRNRGERAARAGPRGRRRREAYATAAARWPRAIPTRATAWACWPWSPATSTAPPRCSARCSPSNPASTSRASTSPWS